MRDDQTIRLECLRIAASLSPTASGAQDLAKQLVVYVTGDPAEPPADTSAPQRPSPAVQAVAPRQRS